MSHPRMRREASTVAAMIHLYCHGQHHDKDALCDDCQALHDYAIARLEHCPFQENKPTCALCSVHCYKREMRDKIRAVMRYAGPRMLFRHPVLAVLHLLDSWRSKGRNTRGEN
jgi:hypothetical protein